MSQKLSFAMEGMLIKEVQDRPALWDSNDPGYSCGILRVTAWQEVGVAIGLSPSGARAKWNSLRDGFCKAFRRKPACSLSEGDDAQPRYRHYAAMKFLAPFLRQTSESTEDSVASQRESRSSARVSKLSRRKSNSPLRGTKSPLRGSNSPLREANSSLCKTNSPLRESNSSRRIKSRESNSSNTPPCESNSCGCDEDLVFVKLEPDTEDSAVAFPTPMRDETSEDPIVQVTLQSNPQSSKPPARPSSDEAAPSKKRRLKMENTRAVSMQVTQGVDLVRNLTNSDGTSTSSGPPSPPRALPSSTSEPSPTTEQENISVHAGKLVTSMLKGRSVAYSVKAILHIMQFFANERDEFQ